MIEARPALRLGPARLRLAWRFPDVVAVLEDEAAFPNRAPERAHLDDNDVLVNERSGEAHQRARRALRSLFGRTAEVGAAAAAAAGAACATLAEDGGGELRRQFAEPVALATVATIVGLPESRWNALRDALAAHDEAEVRALAAGSAAGSSGAASDFMAAGAGNGLREREVVDHLHALALAAARSLPAFLTDLVQFLVADQQLYGRVQADRALVPLAVEEALRLSSPLTMTVRPCAANRSIGALELEAGDAVAVDVRAANRDPACHPEPDRFVLERPRPSHVAFGRGPHQCPAAAPVQIAAAAALNALLDRFASIELAGQGAVLDDEQFMSPRWRAVHVRCVPVQ